MALIPIADGVYVWLAERPGAGRGNAGVVVDDDGVTVIDTLMVRSQWEPFAVAVGEIGRPIRRIVLTSARIDHVGGTRAFPHAAVYGSEQTSVALDLPMPVDAYRAFMPAFDEELVDLAEFGTRTTTHIVDGADAISARCEVMLVSGHTDGDVIVIVEDADLLFAGDLCTFGVTPLAFQGDLVTWIAVLETLPDLADTIVPGHGPVGGEAEVLAQRDYLQACIDAHGDPSAIPPGPWDTWAERSRDAINVERAAMLAHGDDGMPPSMLRAIGLA